MKIQFSDTIVNDTGLEMDDAQVYVTDIYGNLSTLYATRAGAALANPTYADDNGRVSFHVDPGTYVIRVSDTKIPARFEPTSKEFEAISGADEGIENVHLRDGSFGTDEIADGAIDSDHIANYSQTTGAIPNNIGATEIAANAITPAKIAEAPRYMMTKTTSQTLARAGGWTQITWSGATHGYSLTGDSYQMFGTNDDIRLYGNGVFLLHGAVHAYTSESQSPYLQVQLQLGGIPVAIKCNFGEYNNFGEYPQALQGITKLSIATIVHNSSSNTPLKLWAGARGTGFGHGAEYYDTSGYFFRLGALMLRKW